MSNPHKKRSNEEIREMINILKVHLDIHENSGTKAERWFENKLSYELENLERILHFRLLEEGETAQNAYT